MASQKDVNWDDESWNEVMRSLQEEENEEEIFVVQTKTRNPPAQQKDLELAANEAESSQKSKTFKAVALKNGASTSRDLCGVEKKEMVVTRSSKRSRSSAFRRNPLSRNRPRKPLPAASFRRKSNVDGDNESSPREAVAIIPCTNTGSQPTVVSSSSKFKDAQIYVEGMTYEDMCTANYNILLAHWNSVRIVDSIDHGVTHYIAQLTPSSSELVKSKELYFAIVHRLFILSRSWLDEFAKGGQIIEEETCVLDKARLGFGFNCIPTSLEVPALFHELAIVIFKELDFQEDSCSFSGDEFKVLLEAAGASVICIGDSGSDSISKIKVFLSNVDRKERYIVCSSLNMKELAELSKNLDMELVQPPFLLQCLFKNTISKPSLSNNA